MKTEMFDYNAIVTLLGQPINHRLGCTKNIFIYEGWRKDFMILPKKIDYMRYFMVHISLSDTLNNNVSLHRSPIRLSENRKHYLKTPK